MFKKRYFTIEEMCQIQNELNEFTISNWKKELNSNHFITAIIDELGEFLGSCSWKWWKKAPAVNTWNMKIEAIDILHFSLSILILKDFHREFPQYVLCERSTGRNYMIDQHGELDHNVFAANTVVLLMNSRVYLHQINDFLNSVGLTAEEVSAIYMAKAELNRIRQTKGYKTGEYIKVVDGIEDNERLEKIVNSFHDNQDLTLADVQDMVEKEFFIKK